MIESRPNAAPFRILAGEPAMTVVPNLLATGVLTPIASLLFGVWATVLVMGQSSALVVALVSGLLAAVGGGFGPPYHRLVASIPRHGAMGVGPKTRV